MGDEEGGDASRLGQQLTTVTAKVKELETRKQLQQLSRALVAAVGLWETMQVGQERRDLLFKELGTSAGEAKERIAAELKAMEESHAEADEMRTLYVEECQAAWKKLQVTRTASPLIETRLNFKDPMKPNGNPC